MKRLNLLLCVGLFFILGTVASAGGPQFINFQGSLSDANGDPVTDPNLSMVFSIYTVPEEGTPLWTETNTVHVVNGHYTVLLGSQTPFPEDLFENEVLYLGITAGEDSEMTPRIQIGSTPSALHALRADSAGHANRADRADSAGRAAHANRSDSAGHASRAKHSDTADVAYSIVPDSIDSISIKDGSILLIDLAQNGATEGQIIKWDGAAWSLAEDEGGGGEFLPLAGGTMTGAITNTGDPPITMGKGNFGFANINAGVQACVAGSNNRASGAYSVVGGGGGASDADSNSANGDYSTVGGGTRNKATQSYSTVGGGSGNIAGQMYATVGGGSSNAASTYATVGGGVSNAASQIYATVGGGVDNTASYNYATVGGGSVNTASQSAATVSGGGQNRASGAFATVPGGGDNRASGQLSFAAGWKAEASHAGAFVWADQTGYPSGTYFTSERINQFRVRANGGVRFDVNNSQWVNFYDDGANLISTSTGASLTTGGAWTNRSDRNLKENFTSIDGKLLLEKLAQLQITMWNYKNDSQDIKHIGPVAQDFYALFGVGGNDKTISTIDPSGIALAAIQELYRTTQELNQKMAEINELKARLYEVERMKSQMGELQDIIQLLLAERKEVSNGDPVKVISSVTHIDGAKTDGKE